MYFFVLVIYFQYFVYEDNHEITCDVCHCIVVKVGAKQQRHSHSTYLDNHGNHFYFILFLVAPII